MKNEEIEPYARAILNTVNNRIDEGNRAAVIIKSLQFLIERISNTTFDSIEFHGQIHKTIREMIDGKN